MNIPIKENKTNEKYDEVIFEAYLISYQPLIESFQNKNNNNNNDLKFDQTEQSTSMDLDQIWVLIIRVLQIFEETLQFLVPSSSFFIYFH
jgi:hypothetical protein